MEEKELKVMEETPEVSKESDAEMVTVPKNVFITLQNFFISSKQGELELYEQLKALEV